MERVSIIEGKKPFLFIAPHAAPGDDLNTDLVTKIATSSSGGFAVINNGWEKSPTVNQLKDKANCNNIEHCYSDVVREEFLDPILRFKNRIIQNIHPKCYVFIIHGYWGNYAPYILGCGNGKPIRNTCDWYTKDSLIAALEETEGLNGIATEDDTGKYSGWSLSNLNQLFLKRGETNVESIQIEITNRYRNTPGNAHFTGLNLGIAVTRMFEKLPLRLYIC